MSRTQGDRGDVDPLVTFIGTHREMQGYSQLALASRAGIGAASFCQYENGKTKLTVDRARALLAVLGYKLVVVPMEEDE